MVSEAQCLYLVSDLGVLILVLVEDGLGELYWLDEYDMPITVLILVLVEDGLGDRQMSYQIAESDLS